MNKSISNKIKYLYFIFTLGMVMYHAQWLNSDSIRYINGLDHEALSFYSRFANHIGTACMTFFFFMSAFWFYKGVDTKDDLLKKWKKRIKTLIIPFLSWTVILFIYKMLFLGLEFRFEDIFFHLFEKPVAGPLWYLLALLLLQLISPLLIYLKKHKKVIITLFSFISIYIILRKLNYIPTFLVFDRWWWYENVLTYMPAYLLGVYLGMYHSNLLTEKDYTSKNYTIIGIVLLIIAFLLWHYYLNVSGVFTTFYSLIEIVGIWFVLKPSICKRAMPEVINCTFYIYALHNPVLVPLTQKVINFFLRNSFVCGFGMIIIKLMQIIAIVLISSIVKFIIVKFLPKNVDSYLTGGR